MSNIIEDFYYGNLEPQEVNSELTPKLKKKLSNLAEQEEQLTARLTGEDKELFQSYVSAYIEFSTTSNADSFISSFRLGAKFTYDTFVKNTRTLLTSEASINRSSHVIMDPQTNKLRTITPIEAERMQGFNDNWTADMPDRMRYFCMGNALVVPMVTRMACVLDYIVNKE